MEDLVNISLLTLVLSYQYYSQCICNLLDALFIMCTISYYQIIPSLSAFLSTVEIPDTYSYACKPGGDNEVEPYVGGQYDLPILRGPIEETH